MQKASHSTLASALDSILYTPLETRWNVWIILFSYCVGVVGSFTATFPLYMIERSPSRAGKIFWLFCSCLVFGLGCIWSLHFTGMLALEIQSTVYYSLPLTLLSMVIALVGTFVLFLVKFPNIFQVVVTEPVTVTDRVEILENLPLLDSRGDGSVGDFKNMFRVSSAMIKAGFLFACAAASMHYTGMMAMHIQDGYLVFSIPWVLVSFVVAWFFGTFSMNVLPRQIHLPKQIIFAVVAAFGVFCLHYSGMYAATFCGIPGYSGNLNWRLATSIGVVVSIVCFLSTTAVAHTISLQRDAILDAMKDQKHIRQLELEKEFLEEEIIRKSEFLATVSHEIRTPIHAIAGFTDLFNRETLDQGNAENLQMIKQSVRILEFTLENVLHYTRLENTPIIVRNEPVDLLLLIFGSMVTLSSLLDKRIIVMIDYDETYRYKESTDPGLVLQVCQNLISNAYKFTENGFVIVTYKIIDEARGPRACISVCDSGAGVDEQILDHIFYPFTQMHSHLSLKHSGIGIGLYLSKKIASILEGNLYVRSEPNKGSTFTFTFPITVLEHKILYNEPLKGTFTVSVTYQRVKDVLKQGFQRMGLTERTAGDSEPDAGDFHIQWVDIEGKETYFIVHLKGQVKRFPINYPIYMENVYEILIKISNEGLNALCPSSSKNEFIEPSSEISNTSSSSKIETEIPVRKGKIMVVEDNKINQKLIFTLLKKMGYDVVIAENGEDAIIQLEASDWNHFDLIFMDKQMPVMDGIESTKRIREKNTAVPIIALTANVTEDVKKEAFEAGMNDFLEKPLKIHVLKAILEKWIK